jgi:hypothetical protein
MSLHLRIPRKQMIGKQQATDLWMNIAHESFNGKKSRILIDKCAPSDQTWIICPPKWHACQCFQNQAIVRLMPCTFRWLLCTQRRELICLMWITVDSSGILRLDSSFIRLISTIRFDWISLVVASTRWLNIKELRLSSCLIHYLQLKVINSNYYESRIGRSVDRSKFRRQYCSQINAITKLMNCQVF